MNKTVRVTLIFACGVIVLIILGIPIIAPEPVPRPNWVSANANFIVKGLSILLGGLAIFGLTRDQNLPRG